MQVLGEGGHALHLARRQILETERVGVQPHGISRFVYAIEEGTACVTLAQILRKRLVFLRNLASEQVRNGITRGNHRAGHVGEQGKVRKRIERGGVLFKQVLHLLRIEHVEHEHDDVALRRYIEKPFLRHADRLAARSGTQHVFPLRGRRKKQPRHAHRLHRHQKHAHRRSTRTRQQALAMPQRQHPRHKRQPYKRAHNGDSREVSPIHRPAVGGRQHPVHGHNLHICAQTQREHYQQRNIESPPAQNRCRQGKAYRTRQARHSKRQPHIGKPKHQAAGSAGNQLVRSHHQNGKHTEHRHDSSVCQAVLPPEAFRERPLCSLYTAARNGAGSAPAFRVFRT